MELHPKFGLVPVEMMDQIQKIAGRETYDIDCDLMLEVFLVNHSETEVTIRNFSGNIKTKTEKIELVQAEDFARYTLVTKKKMEGGYKRSNQLFTFARFDAGTSRNSAKKGNRASGVVGLHCQRHRSQGS